MRRGLLAAGWLLAGLMASANAARAEPHEIGPVTRTVAAWLDADARAQLTNLIAMVDGPMLQLAYRRADEPVPAAPAPLTVGDAGASALPAAAAPQLAALPPSAKTARPEPALPLPPTPPFPKLGAPGPTVLPNTGLVLR